MKNSFDVITISHYFYPRQGGLEKAVYQQSKYLIGKGIDVLVIYGSNSNRTKRVEGIGTMSFKTLDLFNGTYPLFGFDFAKSLYTTIKANPHAKVVVHARHVMSSFISAFICKLLNREYILVEHTAETSFMKSHVAQTFVNIYENTFAKFVVKNAHKIIAVSQASREFLITRFNVDPSNIKVITNGFESSQIGEVNIKEKKNIVMFASKLIKVKDPITTFNAFNKLAKKYPDWTFLIVGKGTEKIESRKPPGNMKLIDRVLSQSEFIKALKKTKIYVNSSLSEGLPLAVVEAAGCANLLVLSDAPTNVMIANSLNQSNYLFERGNTNQLIEGLEKAIEDSKNIDSFKSIKRLSYKYSLEKILPEFTTEILSKKDYKKLSIVIPVYNEQKTIYRLLNKVSRVNLKDIEKEIIIVDDGSKDKSRGRIDTFIANHKHLNIKFLRNSKNIGKSQSVKKGLLVSSGDLVVIQDADLEYNPADLIDLVSVFRNNSNIKVVYGNRFNDGNKIIYPHFYAGNLLVSAFANLFTISKGILIKDMEVCYKMFDGEFIRRIAGGIKSTSNFGFEPEITAKMSKEISKRNFRNIDISYMPRTIEQGKKIRVTDGLRAVAEILYFNLNQKIASPIRLFKIDRSISYLRSLLSTIL